MVLGMVKGLEGLLAAILVKCTKPLYIMGPLQLQETIGYYHTGKASI